MLHLDVRSVVLANCLYTSVIALFLLFFGYRRRKTIPGLIWWTYGFILFSLSFLLISVRGYLPLFLTNVVAQMLAIGGFYLVKQGLARFYSAEPRYWLDILFLTSGLIALIYFSDGSVWPRLVAICISAIAAFSLTIFMVRGNISARPVRFFFRVAILIQLGRGVSGYFIPRSADPMESGWKLAIISMLFFLSLMMILLSLVTVTVRRLIQEKEELAERERFNSVTDDLTGLMNRRGFKTIYGMEEKRSSRNKSQISLAIADIDGFKDINDTYGHECGDDVLRYVAEVFRREFRGGDILARWGGEEFLVVQPETDIEACRTSLERTRQAIARTPFRREGDIFYVTMSFGFHTAVAGTLEFEEQLKKADDNMYSAKRSGKNRVQGELST